jgi:hypothetical protein
VRVEKSVDFAEVLDSFKGENNIRAPAVTGLQTQFGLLRDV